jgi:putative spermidine/putrescine transport system permease protein
MSVRRASVPYLLVLPATVVFAVFFIAPLVTLTINSFYDYGRLTGIVHVFTLKNYQRIWLDSFYLEVVGRTLRLASVTAVITILVGYPVALYLTLASARVRGIIIFLVLSPLLISVIVRTFGWVMIIGPNGLLQSLLGLLGVDGVHFLHTEAAVVVGLVNVLMPFVVLAVVTALQAIDPAVPFAAASLGAGPWQVFFRVILPLSLPGLLAGMLIVFSLASSTFVTPAVLGGSQFKVLSTIMYQQALILQNWPFAAAVAITLVLIVLVTVTLQTSLAERGRFGRAMFQ